MLCDNGCIAETFKKRPRDSIALAKLIGDIATRQTDDRVEDHGIRQPLHSENLGNGGRKGTSAQVVERAKNGNCEKGGEPQMASYRWGKKRT
jgi:hypothetical protein